MKRYTPHIKCTPAISGPPLEEAAMQADPGGEWVRLEDILEFLSPPAKAAKQLTRKSKHRR